MIDNDDDLFSLFAYECQHYGETRPYAEWLAEYEDDLHAAWLMSQVRLADDEAVRERQAIAVEMARPMPCYDTSDETHHFRSDDMTVRELIAVLSAMDGDRVVILQKDSEGNGYSPCVGADDNAAYEAVTTWRGEVGRQKLSKEDRANGYTKDDLCSKKAVPCVVLWPVN